jgi:hypothetical protein
MQLTFSLPLPAQTTLDNSGGLQGLEEGTDVRIDSNPPRR